MVQVSGETKLNGRIYVFDCRTQQSLVKQTADCGSSLVVETEYDIFRDVFVLLVEYKPALLIASQATLWTKWTSNYRSKAFAADFVSFLEKARSRKHIHTTEDPTFNKFDVHSIPVRAFRVRHSTETRLLYVACDVAQGIDGVNCSPPKEFRLDARIA